MKLKFLIVIVLLNFSSVFSQDDKTVTLTVSAQGATLSEAKQNALRDAIEQAFGAFVSSNTEILNDELVKDEIVSVSNGNIQKFDILSQTELSDIGYAITLSATVSITKLELFAKTSGLEIEFKGGLFAQNIRLQTLNEAAEAKAVLNLCYTADIILRKSIDYTVSYKPPYLRQNTKYWVLDITVISEINENISVFKNYFEETMKNISMKKDEIETYKELNKKIYFIELTDYPIELPTEKLIILRNETSYKAIINLFNNSNRFVQNFNLDIGEENIFINHSTALEITKIPYQGNRNAPFRTIESFEYGNWIYLDESIFTANLKNIKYSELIEIFIMPKQNTFMDLSGKTARYWESFSLNLQYVAPLSKIEKIDHIKINRGNPSISSSGSTLKK